MQKTAQNSHPSVYLHACRLTSERIVHATSRQITPPILYIQTSATSGIERIRASPRERPYNSVRSAMSWYSFTATSQRSRAPERMTVRHLETAHVRAMRRLTAPAGLQWRGLPIGSVPMGLHKLPRPAAGVYAERSTACGEAAINLCTALAGSLVHRSAVRQDGAGPGAAVGSQPGRPWRDLRPRNAQRQA